MTEPEQGRGLARGRVAVLALAALLASGVALYAAGAPSNPPGFYIDESSVAYNAHLIAQTGRDEYGEAWPLYFRAFGDYKNPTYIYLLAALFRLTGPGIAAARLFSAVLGVLTAFLLGLLGARLSRRVEVGLLVALTALLTPWLFELSRVVVEVALYPLALALFLLCVRRASEKAAWSWADASGLAATLALLTYTYSVGRLFAPLLALGLVLFARRAGLRSLLLTWGLYALTLVPMLVFQLHHPGALNARFRIITYVKPQSTYAEVAWEFVKHYAGNLNPWPMLFKGDPNAHQIANIYGVGLILAATFLLAVAGAWVVLRRGRREAWWLFVCYGLAVSVVPASLTNDYFHMLRLAALPVFLVVLCVPSLAWLVEGDGRGRRAALAGAVALTLAQGAVFQWQYRASAHSPRRRHLFDADYPARLLPAALAEASTRPVYLADAPPIPGYIQAFWYATLQGDIPHDRFVLLPPDAPAPEGSVVITTEDACPRCRTLARSDPYTVYVAEGPPRVYAPLPAGGFRAELRMSNAPTRLNTKEQATVRVVVKNTGDAVWLARERGGSPFQLSVGNHWLERDGTTVVNDDGRGPLLRDLRPGEEAEISLLVNAPRRAGVYLLEIDMLQEGVSWFGLKGSQTLRVPLRVE
jgi:4-amino-4-deoxy-L-arabinose transferase-like glycosyltransferase